MLKKSTLDSEVLKNYRPLSNLHFISKILKNVVGQRLEEHLNRYSLHDLLQSAYRKGHSTESAILKTSNDSLTKPPPIVAIWIRPSYISN